MIDWREFIKCKRGLLIAPAGHGKTTAIADCLLQCPEGSRQLVLTHTHAGIASLKSKFRKKNIPSSRYHLETITGFAQRYVLSYLGSSALPEEDEKNYFAVAIEKCGKLLQTKVVQTIIKLSYDGVFVDEYQDCTIDQHYMIKDLAYDLPLHLLGDPLQGIFSFERAPLIDFNKNLGFFSRFDLLKYPWRWKESNLFLGEYIYNLRDALEKHQTIELKSYPQNGVCVIQCSTEEEKFKSLQNVIGECDSNNLLVICPSYKDIDKYGRIHLKGDLNDRIKIKQRVDFYNQFSIVDAIDSPEYYKCAKDIDDFLEKCHKGRKIHKIARFYDIIESLHFNISEISKWIKKKGNRIVEREKDNKLLSIQLKDLYSIFESEITYSSLKNVIKFIAKLPKVKCYHRNFYNTILRCLDMAQTNNISMFEAMKMFKNRVRHQGRKIEGKCFGTTLLTKGLEFDTVIVYDANKFEDSKNFYVAISRACKKLVIITESLSLNFRR